MDKFSYLRPTSIEEALEQYAQAEAGAAYLAGGTDLLLKYKKGQIDAGLIISLNGIPELDAIEDRGETVSIGGRVTLSQLAESSLVAQTFPVLHDAVTHMASVQIRNVATMAGNIVNAAPSADTAPPLLVLGAKLVLQGLTGRRQVELSEFYTGPFETIIQPGEILTEFILPKPKAPASGGYAKLTRRAAMDLALLGVAVQLEFEADSVTCRQAAIGLGVAAPTPIRAPRAEAFLTGRKIDEAALAEAGRIASQEASPRHSVRCEGWYRREMIKVYVKRMGLLALQRVAE